MATIVDPYFFHSHDFVCVFAPGPVHLSVRSLPDLFDSFVMPNSPCHVGPFSQTHTRRNRYRFTNIVITIFVVVRVLALHLPELQLIVRKGVVWGKGLVVEVRLTMIVGLLLLLPMALVLIILMRQRIAILRRFPSGFRSSSHRCHLWTPPVAFE